MIRLPHLHLFRFIKTGVDFIYSDAEVDAAMERQRLALDAGDYSFTEPALSNPFAGPIVDLYRCRCGATEKR